MWVYKAKTDAYGAVSRYTARFVAKGCSQREGIDCTETFSPVIRLASLRVFFSIAAARDLELGGLDIDIAFLYAPIKEDVYIKQPLGFDDGTTNVCHLRRCLYGLKQSPREFNELLRDWLVSQGWRQLMSDPCIYIFEADGVFAMIALYVDDIPVACSNTAWRVAFTALVRSRFDIQDQGDMSDIIGMHITRDRAARTISLDHGKYVCELLDKHDMVDCKPSCLPMDPGFLAAVSKQTHVPLTERDRDIYPSLLGSLQYAAVCTRPDISTALSILGSAQANPTVAHMQAVKKVLRYLKGSPNMSLTLGGVRTTPYNLQALQMQTGAMTVRHDVHNRGLCLHWAEVPSATSRRNSPSSHSPHARQSTTQQRTQPRRPSIFDRCYQKSSVDLSPGRPPSRKTTRAASPIRIMHW
jgi:hypothetical protein